MKVTFIGPASVVLLIRGARATERVEQRRFRRDEWGAFVEGGTDATTA